MEDALAVAFKYLLAGGDEVEPPWWTYGARGMQLLFPSSLAECLSPRSELSSRSVDPELEFDKEVYPIGISLAEVSIIGEGFCIG